MSLAMITEAELLSRPLTRRRERALGVPAAGEAVIDSRMRNARAPRPCLLMHGFAERRDHALVDRRRRKGAFGVPAISKTVTERRPMDAGAPAPLLQVQRFAKGRDHAVVALVRPLCEARNPRHVARFVVPVDVDALNGVVRAGARTNVGKKRLKAVPRRVDLDASRSIPGVGEIFRVGAPDPDSLPYVVFGGAFSSCCVSVRSSARANGFAIQTAAGSCLPMDKIGGAGLCVRSAIAPTTPDDKGAPRLVPIKSNRGQCREPSKALAC
jgi:hypothetical protein